ncbi:MAG: hypothetical protein JOY54_19450 [Acidobacteriaceae bacterium]|nr:hypothetical protein [Acidobacteriaceae bacterium]
MGCLRVLLPLVLALSGTSQSPDSGVLIDNFENAKTFRNWTFFNGAEFPGASGELSLGRGRGGNAAILAYRFTCLTVNACGHYVEAIWKAPSPLPVNPGAALSLWARLPPDIRLGIRVRDQTGQTLQFHADAPGLEHRRQGEWQRVIVPVTAQTSEHWGGSNDGHLHSAILEISVLADSRYPQPVEGDMAFDDVRLLSTTHFSFNLDSSVPVIAAPEEARQLRPRLGVNIHSLNDDRALDLARNAGFGFVRTDLLWTKVEKQGRYDFTPFDELMRSLEARDMGVLWILAYGHPDHGGKAPQSSEDIAAYAHFAAAAVSHFRGHRARFEIWNEPNGRQFLPNPALYPDLLRAALDAIRREDKSAVVSTGGTSGLDFPFLTRLLQSSSAAKASALGVHPYRDSGPETLIPDLMLLEALIRRNGLSLPVWDTEWGYSSSMSLSTNSRADGHGQIGRQGQAVLGLRECLTVWALGLPVAVWYDLRDDGSDPLNREHNFGLLAQDNSDKPAMKALRTLTTAAREHTYTGMLRDLPYGVHAMRLNGTKDIVFVVWNDQPYLQPELRFEHDQLISTSDLMGGPIVPNLNNGKYASLVLDEKAGPVYLRVRTP